jgi:hypothetical protein
MAIGLFLERFTPTKAWRVEACVPTINKSKVCSNEGKRIVTLLHTPVGVWLDGSGTPRRLIWEGRRYKVTDTPTPLEAFLDERVTHPPVGPLPGWRFQGTSDAGESRVFDIRYDRHGEGWTLLGAYE